MHIATYIQLVNDNYLMCYRSSVRLAIRKVMYAPSKQGDQPSVEVSKDFMMSPNKLHLEASLDKEVSGINTILQLIFEFNDLALVFQHYSYSYNVVMYNAIFFLIYYHLCTIAIDCIWMFIW